MCPLQCTTNLTRFLLAVPIGRLVGVLAVLFLLSVLYALALTWAERRLWFVSSYTWLAVVIGVAYTLAGLAILDWRAAVLALAAFGVASVPMIARSIILDLAERAELREFLECRGDET